MRGGMAKTTVAVGVIIQNGHIISMKGQLVIEIRYDHAKNVDALITQLRELPPEGVEER